MNRSMTLARIMIVEDDIEICDLIAQTLIGENYGVIQIHNGLEAIREFEAADYDLVILDIMLPGLDGLEVLRRIREKKKIPVLLLSAKDAEIDKIAGLAGGADDYLTKPFLLGELLARVKAQLRRYFYYSESEQPAHKVWKYKELELDGSTYQVRIRGEHRTLTAKEFAILQLLMSQPQRVFTKSQIFESVWEEPYSSDVDENTVMVHIRRLRTKIEDKASSPVYVQTVWGIGYRLGGNEEEE
ncbi:response regulator transcription factor [Paenibacillus bovis]|nr:response regulator transcription factor [Paenibacillus bovis]